MAVKPKKGFNASSLIKRGANTSRAKSREDNFVQKHSGKPQNWRDTDITNTHLPELQWMLQ